MNGLEYNKRAEMGKICARMERQITAKKNRNQKA